MIQKFRYWLRHWLNSVEDKPETANRASISGRGSVLVRGDDGLEGHPMRLNVYRASGGIVIEARTYDPQRDRHYNSLHVITHDQDLATSLDKIITMESLRG
jgi:hypothetical protein